MAVIASTAHNPLSRQLDIGRMHLRTFLIALRYEMGDHTNDIAKDYGVSSTTIFRVTKLFGCNTRPKVDEQRRAAILHEYLQNIPVKVIAAKHNCSEALISKYATIHGVNRYKPRKDR